jgi:hypothetical protein
MKKSVFISADHGLAVVYFLQSAVIKTLIENGVEVVVLTDGALVEKIEERFGQLGLIIEDLRQDQAQKYQDTHKASIQWWVSFFRRAGASNKINLEAATSYVSQVKVESTGRRKTIFPVMRFLLIFFRISKWVRQTLVRYQNNFTPTIYQDLFEKYQPEMVIASTPGWRLDKYLLREAAARGIDTTTVIVGWDNSSSYNLPGAQMDYAICWSALQKEEMVQGSDWDAERIFIGGIPSYDGYFTKKWELPKKEYFKQHQLDPNRKLISYASSFITFSPNIQNIEALAKLVSENKLKEPSQLLIRLHPNHFVDIPRFAKEKKQIHDLVKKYPHVHVVEPVAMGGEMGHYSGEDMPEKTSMMAHSDIFITVYSTMVVEASAHNTPVVSACIDSKEGWPGNFTLPLSEIGGWPTHKRFIDSGAGLVAHTELELQDILNKHLENPDFNSLPRKEFIKNECTLVNGTSGEVIGNHIYSLLNNN